MGKIEYELAVKMRQKYCAKRDLLDRENEKHWLKLIKLSCDYGKYFSKKYHAFFDYCRIDLDYLLDAVFFKIDTCRYDKDYKNKVKLYNKLIKKQIKFFKREKKIEGYNYYFLAKYYYNYIKTDLRIKYIDLAYSYGLRKALILKAEYEKKIGNRELEFKFLNQYYNEIKDDLKKYASESIIDRRNAINLLAYLYINGDGTNKDVDKGLSLLNENFIKNYNEGILDYYYRLNNVGDYKKINELLNIAKKKEFYNYGELKEKYNFKEVDIKNNIKANEYYNLALKNDSLAQFNLSMCYKYGNGVEQSNTLTFEWLKASYDNGYTDALDELAYCYLTGFGVDKNESLANELINKKYTKEELYQKYLSSKNDKDKLKWLRLSANNGYNVSQYELGHGLLNGKPYKDLEEGFKWLKASYDNGYIKALEELADCYLNGIGVTKNESLASELMNKKYTKEELYQKYLDSKDDNEKIKWLNLSAEAGYDVAQAELGVLYANGEIVDKDINKAFLLIKKSAEQGNLKSKINLVKCYLYGKGTSKDYDKAIKILNEIIDSKDPIAQYLMGYCYEKGFGCEKNDSKAFEYYKLAADQKDIDSINRLGWLYITGSGCEEDYNKAFKCFKEAFENNFSYSCFPLGYCYYYGHGCNKDTNKGFKLIEQAANNNDNNANNFLGDYYFRQKDYNKAIDYFKKAGLGVTNSVYKLSLIYYFGYGVSVDYDKSIYYMKIAASDGHVSSKHNLGFMYYHGKGCKKDYLVARGYFAQAYKMGCTQSAAFLGDIDYEYKKYSDAKKYFELVPKDDENRERAAFGLGKIYYFGLDCEKDYIKSKAYFEEAILKGSIYSYFYLGIIYYYGCGVKIDYIKARQCFEKLPNDKDALLLLGEIYYFGYGENKDYIKARKYYEKSKEKGVAKAAFRLGEIYYFGDGVNKDYYKAFDYYIFAKNNGYNVANDSLAWCYHYGQGCKKDNEMALLCIDSLKEKTKQASELKKKIEEEIEEEKRRQQESYYDNDDSYDDDDDYDDSDSSYDSSQDNMYYDYDRTWGTIDESSDPVYISPYTHMGDDGIQYHPDPFDSSIMIPEETYDDDDD